MRSRIPKSIVHAVIVLSLCLLSWDTLLAQNFSMDARNIALGGADGESGSNIALDSIPQRFD